jgi:hypothetical protein
VFTVIGIVAPSLIFNVRWTAKIGSIHPAVIGLSCVQLVSFYILIFNDQGLSVVLPLSIVLIIAISAIKNYRDIKILFSEIRVTLISDIPVVILSIAIFCFHWRTPLIRYITPVPSTFNNDIASFAQIAQHISSHSFGDVGRIIGLSAGPFARETVPGVFSTIVFSSQILRQSIAYSLLPILGLSTLILALSFQKIIWQFSKSKVLNIVISVFALSTPLFYYIGNQYFLAQIQAITFLVAIFAVSLNQRTVEKFDRVKFTTITIQSCIVAAMFLTYPQYVVLQFAVFIVVVFEFANFRRLCRNLFSAVLIFGIGSVLILPNLVLAINRTLNLAGDSASGWPMPWVTPSQLLGFQWNVFRAPMEGEIDASFVMVVFYILFYVIYCKKTLQNTVFNRLIIFTCVTYALVILRSGASSYVQFKWISSLAPILVFCLVSIVLINSLRNANSLSKLGVSIAVLTLIFSNLARTLWYDSQHASKLGILEETVLLKNSTVVEPLESLNIKTGPFKESMWPAFFLEDKKVAIIDPSYYSVVEPLSAPTLVNKEFNTFPWVSRKPVSDIYDLVSYPKGKLSTIPTGLKADISIGNPALLRVGVDTSVAFVIANIGSSTWLGSGQCLGCVNASVRVVSENGLEVISDWNRVSLGDFPNYVSLGQKVAGSTVLNISKPGRFTLEMTLVSEHVSWFNQIDTSSYRSIQIEVSD